MRTLLRFLALGRPVAGPLLGAIAVAAIATAAGVALMAIAGAFVTGMALAGLAGRGFDYFTPSAMIRAAAILRTGGRWVERVTGHAATFRLSAEFRTRLFERLERIAPAGLADLASGDLLALLKTDVDRAELVHLRLVAPLAVALLVGAGAVAFAADRLAAAGLALAALLLVSGVALPALLAGLGRTTGRTVARASADLRRDLHDPLRGLAPRLLPGTAAEAGADLDRAHRDRLAAEARLGRLSAAGEAAVGLSGDLAVVAMLALGGGALAVGRLAGADLGLLVLLAVATFEAIAPLPAAFAGSGAMLASLDRIFALADRTPPVADPPAPRAPGDGHDLALVGVGFTRPGGRRALLDRVDLTIPAGARVAVLGESGTGKSTLLDLLVRALDPDHGEIRLGGIPLPALALGELRRRVALVPQHPHVFTATLADNLRFVRPTANDDDLRAALAAVGLADRFGSGTAGLATLLGAEGVHLSGGEIRRLAVARGLLAAAPVLLLDEPTEGLDRESADRLIAALDAEAGARTLIVVTHDRAVAERMATVLGLSAGRLETRRAVHPPGRDAATPAVEPTPARRSPTDDRSGADPR